MKYVLAVSQAGSFRETSKKLYTTRPIISTLIHDLKEELNITIFKRTSRGTAITPDARSLLSCAKKRLTAKKDV